MTTVDRWTGREARSLRLHLVNSRRTSGAGHSATRPRDLRCTGSSMRARLRQLVLPVSEVRHDPKASA